jgi:branched-chain amino acid transport system substrate-binding protein
MSPKGLAAAALACALHGGCGAQELVIGQVATLDNPRSAVGNQLRRGALLCFEAVNRAGGVHGKSLTLVSKSRSDNDTEEALRKTRELLAEAKPVALLNLMGTGAMEALVKDKLLEREGIPVVGIRTGATSLHQPVHPWLFHTRANYGAEVRKIVRHFATISATRIALVHESSPFGGEIQRLAEEEMRALGLAFVARAAIDTAKPDHAAAIGPLAAARTDAILVAMNSNATADFYKTLRSKGISAHVIALSIADGTQVVKRIGVHDAHGLGIAQVTPDPTSRTTGISREFQNVVKAANGPESDLNQASFEGFIAAKVLVEGLKRAGPDPTRARVRQALEGIPLLDLGGMAIKLSGASHSGSQFVDIAILSREGKMLR